MRAIRKVAKELCKKLSMRNLTAKYSWTYTFSLQSQWRENEITALIEKVDDYP